MLCEKKIYYVYMTFIVYIFTWIEVDEQVKKYEMYFNRKKNAPWLLKNNNNKIKHALLSPQRWRWDVYHD